MDIIKNKSRIAVWYRDFFHINEVEKSETLKIVAWALLLGWFLEFSTWFKFSDFTINAVEEGRQLCWPFFQSCGDWYFLTLEPIGNTHVLMYGILFGLLITTAYTLIRGMYTRAHVLFLCLFLWEMTVLLMSMRLAVNYWYFHVFYVALFLFPVGKLMFLRLGAVFLYFFSGILKLDDGWLTGSYFKALSEGLYFIPDTLIPVATNAVIFIEIVLVWFLLSSKRGFRMPVLVILFIFHVYSVLFVGYTYPTIALSMVLVLFLSNEGYVSLMQTFKKSVTGIGIFTFFIIVHFIPYTIPGDSRITGEGNKFGMYMFDANYQCNSKAIFHQKDGQVTERESKSFFAIQRCDPYSHLFYLKNLCSIDSDIERVEWAFDISVNGSPLQRIVDEENACNLSYRTLSHNEWIKIPGVDEVSVIGPVSKNSYRPI
ncbi:hypothetical protein HQ403_01990 [Candidatus Kaiserbacteria bacterium]|nr:hypothetical protein [Candidatus Kaiserbacteria bacterium]